MYVTCKVTINSKKRNISVYNCLIKLAFRKHRGIPVVKFHCSSLNKYWQTYLTTRRCLGDFAWLQVGLLLHCEFEIRFISAIKKQCVDTTVGPGLLQSAIVAVWVIGGQAESRLTVTFCQAPDYPYSITRGTLKTREMTSRDRQNCGGWQHETGQRETR